MTVSSELRQLVWSRAAGSCEYYRMPDQFDPLPFADHIRPHCHPHKNAAIATLAALNPHPRPDTFHAAIA